jgi:HSP20 family protein
MLSRFTHFDRTLALMDDWRRRMDRAFGDFQVPFAPAGSFEDPWSLSEATWPRVDLHDAGTSLVLTAEVPGLAAKDLQIQLENDVLTLSGERKVATPEGYTAHRRERGSLSFTRSFNLPVKVDGEKTIATLKDGVLTLEMTKLAEAQPRQIAIRTGA